MVTLSDVVIVAAMGEGGYPRSASRGIEHGIASHGVFFTNFTNFTLLDGTKKIRGEDNSVRDIEPSRSIRSPLLCKLSTTML